MRQQLGRAVQVFAVLFAGIFPWLVTAAQDIPAASLEDQLKAHYKSVKMGSDGSGLTVLEPGTVLVVQKAGILGVPPGVAVLASKYHDGTLQPPSSFLQRMLKDKGTRFFQVGEKVYTSKVDVNRKGDKIAFRISECNACNGVKQPSSYKSEVIFQFPKGYLESAQVGRIEDVISQVFAIDTGAGGTAQPGQDPQGQQSGQAGQQPSPPTEPPTIQLGQTPEQVQAILGAPDKMVDLGSKQIYLYKDLKVTFVSGKVSDVQ